MKKSNLLTVLLFITCLCCKEKSTLNSEEIITSEKVNGPANIRDSINGKIILTLNDNSNLNVVSQLGDWYSVTIYLDSINILEDKIYKNDSVFQNKKPIGVAKTNLTTYEFYENSHFIEGFTHKDNIKKESLIENVILSNLNKRDLEDWNSILRKYNFEQRDDFLHYKGFEIYENNDPSPGFRILLLFEKNRLVGFYHSRTIASNVIDTHKINKTDHLSFYKDYDKQKVKRFTNYMISWLKGVD